MKTCLWILAVLALVSAPLFTGLSGLGAFVVLGFFAAVLGRLDRIAERDRKSRRSAYEPPATSWRSDTTSLDASVEAARKLYGDQSR